MINRHLSGYILVLFFSCMCVIEGYMERCVCVCVIENENCLALLLEFYDGERDITEYNKEIRAFTKDGKAGRAAYYIILPTICPHYLHKPSSTGIRWRDIPSRTFHYTVSLFSLVSFD